MPQVFRAFNGSQSAMMGHMRSLIAILSVVVGVHAGGVNDLAGPYRARTVQGLPDGPTAFADRGRRPLALDAPQQIPWRRGQDAAAAASVASRIRVTVPTPDAVLSFENGVTDITGTVR